MNRISTALQHRPTEVVTGFALAAAVAGFLVERGVSEPLAAVVAIVIALVPAAISEVVDKIRGPLPPEVQALAEELGRREAEKRALR